MYHVKLISTWILEVKMPVHNQFSDQLWVEWANFGDCSNQPSINDSRTRLIMVRYVGFIRNSMFNNIYQFVSPLFKMKGHTINRH